MKGFNRTLAAFVLAFLTAGAAGALDAKVISVSGKVEVQKNGSATWTPLKTGDSLSKGSVISTGFKSSAKIQIDGSTVTLEPLTRMTIEKLASSASKDESKLYLNSGKVSADVKKSSGKKVEFKVTSPVATASVRGTRFRFSSRGDLITMDGLVSKGRGAPHANIAKSDEVSEFIPADGKSTVTTSTEQVSGNREVPVSAGQSSGSDLYTGLAVDPQKGKAGSAGKLRGDGTASLASKETSRRKADGMGPIVNDSVDRKSGTVVISVTVED
ncbi:MAG: FecR domain-containing protein [Treponema sp.]|nr:FecR domain-containing protein [Treponema sp.]